MDSHDLRELASRQRRGILFCLVLVAACLRLFRLGAQSIWLDEGFQFLAASPDSVAGVLAIVLDPKVSTHPPLSHLIHHAFLEFGHSDFLLRLPAALFGIATIPLFYLLTKRLTSTPTALLAAALMTISPRHVWFSQEARMYAQLAFFVVLSSLFLLRALERGTKLSWIFYVLAGAGGMYTHIFMGFSLLAQGVWALAQHPRRRASLIAAAAAIGILFLPMVEFFFGSYETTSGNNMGAVDSLDFAALPYTFFAYGAGFSLGPSVRELNLDRSAAFLLQFLPAIATVSLSFGGLLLISLTSFGEDRRAARSFCLLGLFAPIAGSLIFASFAWASFNVRYTIGAFPFFCVLVASALTFLGSRNGVLGGVFGIALVAIASTAVYNHFTEPRYAKENIRAAIDQWRRSSPESELVTIGIPWAVERYVRPEERQRFSVIRNSDYLEQELGRMLSTERTLPLWLLLTRDWDRSQQKRAEASFAVTSAHSFPGAELLRLSSDPPHPP